MTTDGPSHELAREAGPRPPEQWWLADRRGPDGLIPAQRRVVPRDQTPDTIVGWQALVEGHLTNQCCAFHRNMEISSRYAWVYNQQPASFKWAAMAAFASHHVRRPCFRSGWTPMALGTSTSRAA